MTKTAPSHEEYPLFCLVPSIDTAIGSVESGSCWANSGISNRDVSLVLFHAASITFSSTLKAAADTSVKFH